MKKLLKAFVAWLDRKFPDKVIVTLEEYQAIDKRISTVEESIRSVFLGLNTFKADVDSRVHDLSGAIHNRMDSIDRFTAADAARIKKLEDEISKLNAAYGFAGTASKFGGFQR